MRVLRPGLNNEISQPTQALFFKDQGCWAIWEPSMLCPCHDEQTDHPDPTCPCLKDYGRIYLGRFRIELLVTNQDWSKRWAQGFPSTSGKVALSFPPEGYKLPQAIDSSLATDFGVEHPAFPAEGDRITLIDQLVCIADEMKKKGEVGKNGLSLEYARFRTIKRLLRVATRPTDRSAPVFYGIGTDVKASPDEAGAIRQIEWLSTHVPEEGERYSIRYLTQPEFLVKDPEPRYRRQKKTTLGPFVRAIRVDQVRGPGVRE